MSICYTLLYDVIQNEEFVIQMLYRKSPVFMGITEICYTLLYRCYTMLYKCPTLCNVDKMGITKN